VINHPDSVKPANVPATDNAIAALGDIVFGYEEHIPQAQAYMQLWLERLPLKEDEVEGRRVHHELVERIGKEHPGVLGANNCNLPLLIKILASIYDSSFAQPETNLMIRSLFERLGANVVGSVATGLNKRQQRQVERIFKSISSSKSS